MGGPDMDGGDAAILAALALAAQADRTLALVVQALLRSRSTPPEPQDDLEDAPTSHTTEG